MRYTPQKLARLQSIYIKCCANEVVPCYVQKRSEGGTKESQKQPEVDQEADVQLEEDDYALLAEFGDRIDFLTGERAVSLAQDPAAAPRKRCARSLFPTLL